MKVKDLRRELKGVPADADVLVGVVEGDMVRLYPADIETTGYGEMGEPCDKDGNPIDEEDFNPYSAFTIFPVGVCTVESSCDESQVVEATLK